MVLKSQAELQCTKILLPLLLECLLKVHAGRSSMLADRQQMQNTRALNSVKFPHLHTTLPERN